MADASRRGLFKTLLAGAAAAPFAASEVMAAKPVSADATPIWGQGVDGQRTADLGNDKFITVLFPAIIRIRPFSRMVTTTT